MWPYTHDESNWLTSDPVHPRPPSLAGLERAARHYRSRVIAGWIRSGFSNLRQLARAALYRRRAV